MEPAPEKVVVPNPRIPRTIGTLNIAFATVLMMCGICGAAYSAILPSIGRATEQLKKDVEVRQEAERKTALETLAKEEAQAKTESEKAEIQEERKALEAKPKPALPATMDAKAMGLEDPKLLAYTWTDLGSGIVLNLLLLASGIGLVCRKLWGLKLALWVAAIKIVRLVALYGYLALVIVPEFSVKIAKAAAQMIAQQPQPAGAPAAPPPVDLLVRTYTIGGTVYAAAIVLFGVVYPIIVLWLLTRPSARAACVGANKALPLELDEAL